MRPRIMGFVALAILSLSELHTPFFMILHLTRKRGLLRPSLSGVQGQWQLLLGQWHFRLLVYFLEPTRNISLQIRYIGTLKMQYPVRCMLHSMTIPSQSGATLDL